jgi:hypothetical protein
MSVVPLEAKISNVKNAVSFVYVKDSTGEYVYANGTGFMVAVKDPKNPVQYFGYFVTAKHVLRNTDGEFYSEVFVRLNKKDGGVGWNPLALSGENRLPICTHSDETVDLALIPAYPSQEVYKYNLIDEQMITTKERFKEMRIEEGDEVLFTGLFTHFVGAESNNPITRFGHVSLISEERIPWQNEMLELYLVECQAYGGNSGSPVFFNLGAKRGGIQEKESEKPRSGDYQNLLLAGVMMGYFTEPSRIEVTTAAQKALAYQNIGIAAVVPAYLLHDILYSEALCNARESGTSIPSV